MNRSSSTVRFALLFAAVLALPLAVSPASAESSAGASVASTEPVAAVPDAATVLAECEPPDSAAQPTGASETDGVEASFVPCAEGSSDVPNAGGGNFSGVPVIGKPGGPFRGYCRCTCSSIPNCSTNADCGGSLCLKGPTCC